MKIITQVQTNVLISLDGKYMVNETIIYVKKSRFSKEEDEVRMVDIIDVESGTRVGGEKQLKLFDLYNDFRVVSRDLSHNYKNM